ncbi:MAG: MFS transporter [Chloroflexi bacterium]|nr:MFS transporter [Chloroflexota bacterium]MYK62478.1 MFS transporter [Chloroflexota bacterium]
MSTTHSDSVGTSSSGRRIADSGPEEFDDEKSLGLMIGISAGHGIKHFGQGALLVMMPFIRSTFAVGDVAYGTLFAISSISSGIANVPAGMLADMYRKRVAWLLTISMLMVGAGYFLIGISPWVWLIALAIAVVGFGTSMWHAPAFGTLAARYPKRRGVAMSAHLTGAQIGNTASPAIIGFLLGGAIGSFEFSGFDWRWVSVGVSVPMFLTAIAVLWRFKTAGAEAEHNLDLTEYLASARRLLTNFRVLGLVSLGAFRSAVHTSFQAFIVVYMKESLEMSAFTIGWHVSLLTFAGIVSTPVMGWLSDRIGRKPVIFVAMAAMAALVFLLLPISDGIGFTIVLGSLGLFFFSVMPIITAATMDQVERGSEGSATALIFTGGSVVGSLSPILAGKIFETNDFEGIVIYCGAIAAVGALLALILPMRRLVS